MGEVVPLRARALRTQAQTLVAELGDRARYIIGAAARLPDGRAEERADLLALADEIEAVQGFGWYFPDDEPVA